VAAADAGATPWPRSLLSTIKHLPELQPWANHVALRTLEMDIVRAAVSDRPASRLLEIGCGNGFGSAYLADLADRIIATDLPNVDVSTHSIGLERTRRLFDAMGVPGVSLLACSGERLPLQPGSVDLVLGLYSLEHVPDRGACLRETVRVLSPGGTAVFTVPATAWSLLYPGAVYGGLLRRLIASPEEGLEHQVAEGAAPTDVAPGATLFQRFRRSYPRFPLPEPHGAFRSYPAEVWHQRPAAWRRLFESSGLRVERVQPMAVLPHLLLSSVFGSAGFRVYERLLWLDRLLCRLPGAWRFAQFILVVGRKP
jgi:SAM-dependent methyltransferase